jgi:hypothetical protein
MEGPRSTAAVGPAWLPFQRDRHERAWKHHSMYAGRKVAGRRLKKWRMSQLRVFDAALVRFFGPTASICPAHSI